MPDPGMTCATCQQILFSQQLVQKDEHAEEEECAQRCQRPENKLQKQILNSPLCAGHQKT